MPIAPLLADLLATHAGKVVACNIIDATEQDVLSRDRAKEALIFCNEVHNDRIRPLAEDDLRQKKTYVLFHKIFASYPSLRFQSNHPADDAVHDRDVCWVTSFKALSDHFINFSKVSAHLIFSEKSDFTVDKMTIAIAALTSAETKPSAILRGQVETWWHTEPATLDAVIGVVGVEEQANRARDWLGLIHHEENAALVAIIIPAEAVAAAERIKRPTFVEAGDHPRFRSWFDGTPPDWGRAVNLLAQGSATIGVIGGEERVASPVPFPALDKVNARLLGIVKHTRKAELSDDWFLSLIMRARDVDALSSGLAQLAM